MRKMPNYEIEYGSEEWYLYHHFKNEKPVFPLILLSIFLLICRGGQLWIIIIWIYYFSWASKNNRELDNDLEVLKDREGWRRIHERLNKSK